jgi:hypothetical protein
VYSNWVFLVIFGIGFPILYVWGALPLVIRALQTGMLETRSRSYSRAQTPVQYWLGVVFWFVVLLATLGTAVAVFAVFLPSLSPG